MMNSMDRPTPRVSVVIPCYNEATYIDRLLSALVNQDFASFEVIVSDAESHDGTAEVAQSFQDRLSISFIESPPRGPAAGRNIGAAKAKGEWLLFLDADDDIDDPVFIRTVMEVTERNGWQSSSVIMKLRDAKLHERMGTYLNYHYIKLLARTKHPVAPGWCIFTRRDLFECLGGFNEKIQFGEDYDYISRAGSQGFGFIEDTYYYLDLRRPREEGLSFAVKGIMNEIYRHTHGYNLEKNPIKYEFGKHKKRSP